MTYAWALSGHFELKVSKDRLVVNLGRLLSVGSSEKFPFKARQKNSQTGLRKDVGHIQGDVNVVDIDNALDDEKLNYPG